MVGLFQREPLFFYLLLTLFYKKYYTAKILEQIYYIIEFGPLSAILAVCRGILFLWSVDRVDVRGHLKILGTRSRSMQKQVPKSAEIRLYPVISSTKTNNKISQKQKKGRIEKKKKRTFIRCALFDYDLY